VDGSDSQFFFTVSFLLARRNVVDKKMLLVDWNLLVLRWWPTATAMLLSLTGKAKGQGTQWLAMTSFSFA
jgi:hypothetical protein